LIHHTDLIRIFRALRAQTIKAAALERDPNEPGRKKKAQFDRQLQKLVMRHFDKQYGLIEQALSDNYPERKALADTPNIDDFIDWDDPDFERDLIIVLEDAARDGVTLFKQTVVQGIDYAGVNIRAADWAKKYAGKLIKNIDDTTRKMVRDIIADFVKTPEMTIGDAMDLMPFGEARSQLVATTEITRTYARANQLAGEALKEQYPDVRVTKTFHTNNDSLVCDICGPLNGQEVDIDQPFVHPDTDEEYDNPGDTHPGCRCWTSTGTRLVDE